MQVFSVHKKSYLSRNTQVHPCQPCQHRALLLLGFPPVQSAQGLISVPVAAIVRFVDVKQSSFRLWSINLVSGNILFPFQQVQLGSQLAPAPLPAALVVHLEIFPLRVKCSHQVAKVAVHIVVGPFYKVLKNCVLQACDVFHVKMIQIWTFPAAPSTKRVLSLAE